MAQRQLRSKSLVLADLLMKWVLADGRADGRKAESGRMSGQSMTRIDLNSRILSRIFGSLADFRLVSVFVLSEKLNNVWLVIN